MHIYTDDLEIIDILKGVPNFLNNPQFKTLNFLEKETYGKDTGMCFQVKDENFILYKYGSIEDSGLLLVKSKKIEELILYVENGVEIFPNKEIYDTILGTLHTINEMQKLQNNMTEQEKFDIAAELFDNISKLSKKEFDNLPNQMKQTYFSMKPILDEVRKNKKK